MEGVAKNRSIWGKIGNWWRGYLPKQDAIREVSRFNSKIDDVIGALERTPGSIQKALGEKFTPFKNKIFSQMTQLKKSLSKLEQAPVQLQGKLTSMQSKSKLIKSRISEIEEQLTKLPKDDTATASKLLSERHSLGMEMVNLKDEFQATKAAFNEATEKANYVKELVGYVNEAEQRINTNLPDGIRYIQSLETRFNESGASVLTELQDVKSWYQNIKNELKEVVPDLMSHKLESQNLNIEKLGGWKKFLKEYARVKGLGPNVQEAWKANPENARILNELLSHENSKIRSLAQNIDGGWGKEEIAKWVGKSPRDIALKLGLPAGILGTASLGGLGVVGWLAHGASSGTSSELKNLSSALSKVGATGPAVAMVATVQRNLNGLADLLDKIEKDLPSEPEKVATQYLPQMETYMTNIFSIDGKTMISNCKDKEKAKQIVRGIQSVLERKMAAFSSAMSGRSLDSLADQISGKEVIPDTKNIEKVQQFLQKTFKSVPVTGNLEQNTISALQMLEKRLNERTQDTEFTGKLFDPSVGRVINYDDLLEIFERIKKY